MTDEDQKRFATPLYIVYAYWLMLTGFLFTIPCQLLFPFSGAKPNNIFFIALVVLSIVIAVRSRHTHRRHSLKIACLFTSVYMLYIIGLWNTDNFSQATGDLVEKKIMLLVFPFLFYFFPSLGSVGTRRVLLIFVWSCVVVSAYCLSVASYRFLTNPGSRFPTHHDFSLIAGLHAIYMALFLVFAIVILIYYYETRRQRIPAKEKIILLLAVLFLLAIIFILAARVHLVLLVVSLFIYSIYRFRQNSTPIVAVGKAGLIGAVLVGIILAFPQNRERFKQLINYKNQYGPYGQWGEQQIRPLIWDCALQLIKKHPLTGAGTGDVFDELHQCYVDSEYTSLTYFDTIGSRFNAHNQFLEFTLGVGVGGAILFLLSLVLPFIAAFREKNFLYCFFTVLIFVSLMSESVLERQVGVAFFSFFNSFLFFNPFSKPSDPLAAGRT